MLFHHINFISRQDFIANNTSKKTFLIFVNMLVYVYRMPKATKTLHVVLLRKETFSHIWNTLKKGIIKRKCVMQ